MTFNPVKNKVYALLKDQAKPEDILKAAFHVSDSLGCFVLVTLLQPFSILKLISAGNSPLQGYVLNHSIRSSVKKKSASEKHHEHDSLGSIAMPVNIESLVAESCKMVSSTYGLFKYKAAEQVT